MSDAEMPQGSRRPRSRIWRRFRGSSARSDAIPACSGAWRCGDVFPPETRICVGTLNISGRCRSMTAPTKWSYWSFWSFWGYLQSGGGSERDARQLGVGCRRAGRLPRAPHWPHGEPDAHRGWSALSLHALAAPAARPGPLGTVPHVTTGAHLVPRGVQKTPPMLSSRNSAPIKSSALSDRAYRFQLIMDHAEGYDQARRTTT